MKWITNFFRTKDREPNTRDYFFVYGSLRKGEYNHSMIEKVAQIQGMARIKGFELVSLGAYPCVVASDSQKDEVIGEVYKVNDKKAIELIDRMEINAGYKRTWQKVTLDNGKKVKVLFYEIDREIEGEIIESGDWSEFLRYNSNKYKTFEIWIQKQHREVLDDNENACIGHDFVKDKLHVVEKGQEAEDFGEYMAHEYSYQDYDNIVSFKQKATLTLAQINEIHKMVNWAVNNEENQGGD